MTYKQDIAELKENIDYNIKIGEEGIVWELLQEIKALKAKIEAEKFKNFSEVLDGFEAIKEIDELLK